ncbi:MAG: zinc ribbon domain-containing protein [Clostridia bacterium]|nr:zinc ribbon domain-containing protein [Clostridia bacterium]
MPRFCMNCGTPLNDGDMFCMKCGTKAAPQEKKITPTAEVHIPEEFQRKNAVRKGEVPYTPPQQPQYVPPQAPQFGQPQVPQYQPQQPPYQQQQYVPPQQVPQYQPQYNAPAKSAPAEKKKRKWIAPVSIIAVILVIAILVPTVIVPLVKGNGGGSGTTHHEDTEFDPGEVKTSATGSVDAENTDVTLCGVKVSVDDSMLTDGAKDVTVAKYDGGKDYDGSSYDTYELSFGGEHGDFYVPVEVTFPCSISSDTDVVVEHYKDGEWQPLFSFVDESSGTVTAYFGSFSPARVSYRPVGLNPSLYSVKTDEDNPYYITVGLKANYMNVLKRTNPGEYSDEVNRFIDDPENYAIEIPELDPGTDLKAAYEGFTKANTMWTFMDPFISFATTGLPTWSQNKIVKFIANHSDDIGGAMSKIPFIAMTAQVIFDLYTSDGDPIATAGANLVKNLISSSGTIYSLVTGYGSIGFSLMFLGVSIFGMELDYFIDQAKAEQVENVKEVFTAYYDEVEPFDDNYWYNVFYNAYWSHDGDPDAAMQDVRDAVDAYCEKFWKEIYKETSDDILFAASAAKYKNVFFNASEDLKQSLTAQQKQKVWELIETKSMKKIQRFLLERFQEKTRKELSAVAEPYNKVLTFSITEVAFPDKGEVAKYKGCTVTLGTDGVPITGWHQNVPLSRDYDSGWTVDFECTVYGYLTAGMPDQVLIYNTEEDYKNGKDPILKKSFTAVMDGSRHTDIDVSGTAELVWVRDEVVYYSYYDNTEEVEQRNDEYREYWTDERIKEYNETHDQPHLMVFETPTLLQGSLEGNDFTYSITDLTYGDTKTKNFTLPPAIVTDPVEIKDALIDSTRVLEMITFYLPDGTVDVLNYTLGTLPSAEIPLEERMKDPSEGDVIYITAFTEHIGMRYRCVGAREAVNTVAEWYDTSPAEYGKSLDWKE